MAEVKLALIPPVSLLGYTAWSDYQLMLPQLTTFFDYQETYRQLCKDSYVILDNGAAEAYKGSATSLVFKGQSYGVDEIVIPDTIGNAAKTMTQAKQFLTDFRHIKDINWMFVCQGQRVDQFVASAIWAVENGIGAIGIPRHAIETCGDKFARIRIANAIQASVGVPIHFLGASPLWSVECKYLADPYITNQQYVRGMDTSMPFNYAFAGALMSDITRPIRRPKNYFALKSDKFDLQILDYNLKQMEEWVRG